MNDGLGVIFDLDGVLIDSYQAHLKSWQVVAAELQSNMTEAQFAATFGKTSQEVIITLWGPQRFSDQQITDFDARKEALFRQMMAADFPAMPGAQALLHDLAADGFALAIGSSAPPENVDQALELLKMRGLFDAVVTRSDVRRGKPDPQVFLTAAARLRLPPQRCVVVEDAALGITAARAAGAAAIGVASTGRTRQSLAEADLVVDRLDELTGERIRQLILRHLERAEESNDETESCTEE